MFRRSRLACKRCAPAFAIGLVLAANAAYAQESPHAGHEHHQHGGQPIQLLCPLDAPRPGVVLLDLHMPGKIGWEVLHEIKSDPDLKRIPMIILTRTRNIYLLASERSEHWLENSRQRCYCRRAER